MHTSLYLYVYCVYVFIYILTFPYSSYTQIDTYKTKVSLFQDNIIFTTFTFTSHSWLGDREMNYASHLLHNNAITSF